MNTNQNYYKVQSSDPKENPESYVDPRYFESIARYIIDLQPSTHNILSIKKFTKELGFPVLILFRSLYSKITPSAQDQYEEPLKYMSTFVRNQTENLHFQELSFYHIVEGNKKNKKSGEKNVNPFFFNLVHELSQIYARLNNFKLNHQNWHEVEELKNTFIFIQARRYFNIGYFEELYLNQLTNLFNDQYFLLSKKKKGMSIEKELSSLEVEGTNLQISKEKGKDNFLQFLSFSMGEPDLIYEQLNQPTELIKNHDSHLPLCCRPFFVFGQFLNNKKKLIVEFRNYVFPFTNKTESQILAILCSLLNEGGGTLLIGMLEERVQGQTMNENLKTSGIDWITEARKRFQPELTQTRLDFVPVKTKTNGSYIPGHFVMRINAVPDTQHLFSYRDREEKEFFCGREKNEVVFLNGRKLLEAYQDVPYKKYKFHDGICQGPEKGILIYNSEITFESFGTCTKTFLVMGYREKEIFEALNSIGVRKSVNVVPKGEKNCLLLVDDESKFGVIHRFLTKVNNVGKKEVFPVFKNLEIQKKDWETTANDQLCEYNFLFCAKRVSKNLVLRFKSKEEACSAFLLLKELKVPTYFTFI